MLNVIRQWFVRTALSTTDELCGSFPFSGNDDNSQSFFHNFRHQETFSENESKQGNVQGLAESVDQDDEEDSATFQGELVKKSLCIDEIWRDKDPPLEAIDLASSVSSTTPSIPREVIVDLTQSPVSLLFKRPVVSDEEYDQQLAEPKQLFRSSARGPFLPSLPYSDEADSTVAVVTVISSLGTECSELQEEEDSLLLGLEHVNLQRVTRPLLEENHFGTKSLTSDRNFPRFSLLDSSAVSPPVIQPKPSAFAHRSSTYQDIATSLKEYQEEDEVGRDSSFPADRQDALEAQDELELLMISGASSHSALRKEQAVLAARRDPPEEDGGSSALFTYSTMETGKLLVSGSDNKERLETEISPLPAKEEGGENDTNLSSRLLQFGDGSSYSTRYNDRDILHAASAVKSMLCSRGPDTRFRKTVGTPRATPTIHRGHWFLPPSSYSQSSISLVSTPSHSPVPSPCDSIDERSV